MHQSKSRRSFLQALGAGAASLGMGPPALGAESVIQALEPAPEDPNASRGW